MQARVMGEQVRADLDGVLGCGKSEQRLERAVLGIEQSGNKRDRSPECTVRGFSSLCSVLIVVFSSLLSQFETFYLNLRTCFMAVQMVIQSSTQGSNLGVWGFCFCFLLLFILRVSFSIFLRGWDFCLAIHTVRIELEKLAKATS